MKKRKRDESADDSDTPLAARYTSPLSLSLCVVTEVMFSLAFVYLFVCLLAGFLLNSSVSFHISTSLTLSVTLDRHTIHPSTPLQWTDTIHPSTPLQ